MSLMIDTEIINEMYTHGGERGEMRHEAAMEILEEEICELAAHCVAAMRRRPKKGKSNFQKLLEEAVENQESGEDEEEEVDSEDDDHQIMSDEKNASENSGFGEDEMQDQANVGDKLSYEALF